MKIKQIILLTVLFGAGMLYSCSDWLDVQPKDKQTEEQLFATKDGFFSAVNGIYVSLGEDALYGRNLSYEMLDVLSKRYKINDKNTYYKQLIAYNYSDESVADELQATWDKAYQVILNCNVILQNIDERGDGVLSEQESKCLKGELLAVRAFLHFDMLRMFGPVYKNKSHATSIPYNESAKAQILPLLPADSIVNSKIMRDLGEAESLLAVSDPVIKEGVLNSTLDDKPDNSMRYRQLRFNYYAVLLLKARVLLYATIPGDAAAAARALTAARKITEDPVVNGYFPAVDPSRLLANNTTPDRMFSTECLFGLYNKNRGLIFQNSFSGENAGENLLQPRDGFVDGYLFSGETASDYRYLSQWATSTAVGIPGKMFLKYKQIDDPDSKYFYGTFCSLIKISEAWYIAAEAETDLGRAYGYLNTARQRRGVPALGVGTSTQLLSKIRNEYLREFIGEGQIFFMYKRMYVSVASSENGYNTSGYAANEARYVLPLPESEIGNR